MKMTRNGVYADRTIAAYRWRSAEAIKNWGRRRKPSKFARHFIRSVVPHGKILDYGCGIGMELAWMRRRGFRAEGIDGALEFVNEAKRRCPGARIMRARFETAPVPAGEYDGIWCNAALIHVPPGVLHRQLRKLRDGLKPDGVMGLTLAWGRRKGFTQRDWIPGRYVAGYTKKEAAAFFRGWRLRGLKVVSRDGRKGCWVQILASS